MILYVNENNEIKDVNTTSDPSLIALQVDDETNPFKDWTIAKICCYKATVSDGIVISMTPYIDSTIVEMVDRLGKQIEELGREVKNLLPV